MIQLILDKRPSSPKPSNAKEQLLPWEYQAIVDAQKAEAA